MTHSPLPQHERDDAIRLAPIIRALAKLRYGSVEIVVHDGRIVQVERREKVRVITDGAPAESEKKDLADRTAGGPTTEINDRA